MTILNVPDMHCEKCVARISDALTAAAVAYQVDLDNKTVAVDESKVALAISELDDLGFDATV